MGQAQEDELKENNLKVLYAMFGEVIIKLEYYQARYMELKNQIAQNVAGKPK